MQNHDIFLKLDCRMVDGGGSVVNYLANGTVTLQKSKLKNFNQILPEQENRG